METATIPTPKTYPEALAAWQAQVQINAALHTQLERLQSQLDWFRRQLFGQKSERWGLVKPRSLPTHESEGLDLSGQYRDHRKPFCMIITTSKLYWKIPTNIGISQHY